MFDMGWISDLALGAVALGQLRGFRRDVRAYMTQNDAKHDSHDRRLGALETAVVLPTGK